MCEKSPVCSTRPLMFSNTWLDCPITRSRYCAQQTPSQLHRVHRTACVPLQSSWKYGTLKTSITCIAVEGRRA